MPAQRVILTRAVMEHAIRYGWPVNEVCRRYRVTQGAVYSAQWRFGLKLPGG